MRKPKVYLYKVSDIFVGGIYKTNNFGNIRIIRELSIEERNREKRTFEVEFLNTNILGSHTRKICEIGRILEGVIRDPYKPTIFGIACIGMPKVQHNNAYNISYHIWRGIINRCYNKNDKAYINYGAVGVRVCQRWLCFEFFLQDLPMLENYQQWLQSPSREYHFDKDVKQQGLPPNMKVYSPETCMFIPAYVNENERAARNLENTNVNFIGVRFSKGSPNFQSYTTINGKLTTLGTYKYPEAAATIRDWYLKFKHVDDKYIMNNTGLSVPFACSLRTLHNDYLKPMCHINYDSPAAPPLKDMCRIVDKEKE